MSRFAMFSVESLDKSVSSQKPNIYTESSFPGSPSRHLPPVPFPRYVDMTDHYLPRARHASNRSSEVINQKRCNASWSHEYESADSEYEETEFSRCARRELPCEVSPTVALRRVLLLYDNLQYREAADFISRLNYASLKGMLNNFPIPTLIDNIPSSLPILEVLYAKVFVNSQEGLNVSMKSLRPESVVMQLVKMFALQNPMHSPNQENNCLWSDFQEKFASDHPVVISTKRILKVILLSEPRVKKQLDAKKKGIDKAIDGLGHHGLVGTSDNKLMNLHDALKLEFGRVVQQFKSALQKLEELSLAAPGAPVSRSVSKGPAPCKASHQRQLSLRQEELQERLIKNKTLLTAVEPCLLTNQALQILLGILQQRIEYDKEAIFQFTQLRKQYSPISVAHALPARFGANHGNAPNCATGSVSGASPASTIESSAVIAPVLMRFSHGCGQVLHLLKQLSVEPGKEVSQEEDGSDISGYHSDSDSTLVGSLLHHPYQQSQRSGKRHNSQFKASSKGATRLDRTEPSLCEDNPTASHASGLVCEEDASSPGSDGENCAKCSPITVKGSIWTQQVRDNTEVETLRRELVNAKQSIFEMREKEMKMKERLADQAQRMLERGIRFENVCLGDRRPTALIRRYGNLYAQARVDTLDALDGLSQLRDADELKSKLLFSVVVLAFRSVRNTLHEKRQQVRQILQIPQDACDPVSKDFESSLSTYFNQSAEFFDTRMNVEEVCSQIWATLYDYPSLKGCEGLSAYVKDCVRLAWALATQCPPFFIEYETRTFRRDMHVRFHSSNQDCDTIKTYLWPALLEDSATRTCVHKGVVVT